MKRLLAALFLALVGALVVASGVASADPPNDFTTGAGKIERTQEGSTIEEKFAFSAPDEDAIGGPTSTARNGHYVYERTITSPTETTQTLELKGDVDCVWVEDNRAFFGGPIEKSNEPTFVGRFAYFDAVDNDQPAGNIGTGSGPDQFQNEFTSPRSTCLFPLIGRPITSGNIVVNDAQ
jgi:hypothetical protein